MTRVVLYPLLTAPVVFAVFSGLLAGYDEQRIALVIVLLTAAGLYSYGAPASLSKLHRSKLDWLFVAVIAAFFLPILVARETSFQLAERLMYGFYFLAVWLTGAAVARLGLWTESFRVVAYAILVCTTVYALANFFIYWVALLDGQERIESYVPSGFLNIRYWSHLATWLLPILAFLALADGVIPSRKLRVLASVTGGFWWWMLWMTVGRGSLAGLILAAALSGIICGKAAMPLIRALVVQAIIGGVLWLLLTWLLPGIFMDSPEIRELKMTNADRTVLWEEAWLMFQHQPLTGTGPLAWMTHQPFSSGYLEGQWEAHPHNMYLLWLSEYGVFAGGSVIALGVGLLASLIMFRRKLGRSEEAGMALYLAFIAAAIHAFVSAVFIAGASMLVGFVLLSLLWGWCTTLHRQSQSVPKVRRGGRVLGTISLAFVLGVGGLWLTCVNDYWKAMNNDQAFYNDEVKAGLLPRFWASGLFPRREELMPPNSY